MTFGGFFGVSKSLSIISVESLNTSLDTLCILVFLDGAFFPIVVNDLFMDSFYLIVSAVFSVVIVVTCLAIT